VTSIGAPLTPDPARQATTARALWFFAVLVLLLARILVPWSQPLGDPDFWWLWWFGSQWLHGAMPTLNTMSWTAPDMPWVTHEAGVGLIYGLVGPAHLGLMRCLLLAATWLILTYAAWRPDGGRALPFSLGWAMLLVTWGVSERALSSGNLMMAVTVALTTPARRLTGDEPLIGGSPFVNMSGVPPVRLALAALSVGVWANLHGSFPVGVLLVGLTDWRWGLTAAAATLANPHGIFLWELLRQYLPGTNVNNFIATVLPEWQPLDLASLSGLGQAALMLLALPLVWPLRWRPVLLWAAFALMASRHARFIDQAAIVLLPWVSAGLARRIPPLRVPSPIAIATAAAVVAALAFPSPTFQASDYPAHFPFEKLAGHRVWNEYTLGGFLGAHGVAVFWDPRVDCYPANVLTDGVAIESNDAARGGLLDRWQVDRVVARSAHILDPLRQAGWRDDGGAGDIHILARPPHRADATVPGPAGADPPM